MFNMLAAFCVPGAAVLLSLLLLGCERIFRKVSQSNVKKQDVSHRVLNISEVRKDTSISTIRKGIIFVLLGMVNEYT